MPIPTPPNLPLTARPIDAETFYAERAALYPHSVRFTFNAIEQGFDAAIMEGDFETAEGLYDQMLGLSDEQKTSNSYVQIMARLTFRHTSFPLFERFLRETGSVDIPELTQDITSVHPNIIRQLQSLRDQRRRLINKEGIQNGLGHSLFGFEAEVAVLALHTRLIGSEHDNFNPRPATFAEDNAKRLEGFRSGVDLFAHARGTDLILKTQVKSFGSHDKGASKYHSSIDTVSLPSLAGGSQALAEELKHALIREQQGNIDLRQKYMIERATNDLQSIYAKRLEKLSA